MNICPRFSRAPACRSGRRQAFPDRHFHPIRAPSDRCRRPRGFTLLELLVVIVIIGLLAGYVGPRYFAQVGKSEVKVARAQIDAFEKALDTYRLDVGRYPTTEEGLTVLEVRPGNEAKWQGPYLKKSIPPDPWGKPYQYRSPGEKNEFDIFSFGKDGQAGGEGENADIGNWN
ncbi:MAG: type II secretion system major pseudopilin GspG [Betaproteobacteria bacterium]|nr:type II secretion system major pseudopilin GspG [Betaproteobacteria bacterium]